MSGGLISFTRGENPLRADKLNSGLAERVLRSGDKMTGLLTLAMDPANALDAATKQYVDRFISTGEYLPVAGGTMLGTLTLAADPVNALHAATKQYVDANDFTQAQGDARYLQLVGGTLTGANPNIMWPSGGTGPPTTTTRSVGTKLVLNPTLSGTNTDIALGRNGNDMWLGVSSGNFAFYGRTNKVANLDSFGNLTLGVAGTNNTLLFTPGGSSAVAAQITPSGTGGLFFNTTYPVGFGGVVTLGGDPVGLLDGATKQYVDGQAQHNVGRNLLHNPLFNVAQRGAGPFTTSGYTADRWSRWTSTDTISASVASLSDADRAGIGDETARVCLLTTFTGAGNGNGLFQSIEDVRRLGNKTVTISFWAIASAALKLGVSFDQFFGSGGSPSALVNGVGQAVTLTTGWARYSLTFAVASTTGKTLGTNNDSCTKLNFWYSAGAVNATASGNIGLQSGGINLWGVQLEIGSVATPLEKPDPRYDLSNCQRFYQTFNAQINGYTTAGNNFGASLNVPTMRAAPTISGQTYTGAVNASGPSIVMISNTAVMINCTATATGQIILPAAANLSADL